MIQNQNINMAKEGFRRQRRKRSDLLLELGLAVELSGIIGLVLAFGPIRGSGASDNSLEIVTTNLGIFITSAGMLLSLAGTIGGAYYATRQARQLGYLAALLGAAGQIIGFTWDNILHATGHTHFDAAHNTAIGGLMLLILASLFLVVDAKRVDNSRRKD